MAVLIKPFEENLKNASRWSYAHLGADRPRRGIFLMQISYVFIDF